MRVGVNVGDFSIKNDHLFNCEPHFRVILCPIAVSVSDIQNAPLNMLSIKKSRSCRFKLYIGIFIWFDLVIRWILEIVLLDVLLGNLLHKLDKVRIIIDCRITIIFIFYLIKEHVGSDIDCLILENIVHIQLATDI